MRFTNTDSGSIGAGIQLNGVGADWGIGTDAGLSGGNNFFIQDNQAGYPPRLLIDDSGNVAIGTDNPGYKLDVVGDIAVTAAGSGFRFKEGTNATMGVANLSGGAATVTTTAVTTASRIFLTVQNPSGTVGTPYVWDRAAGTSFTIKSTSAADNSTVAWILIGPS